jgi:threonyl-tRNA synthetase
VRAKVLPLSEKFLDYGRDVVQSLRNAGLRAELDVSDEKLGYKVRRAEMEKVPYALVVGGREAETRTVGVRKRKDGDLGSMSIEAFAERLADEAKNKVR